MQKPFWRVEERCFRLALKTYALICCEGQWTVFAINVWAYTKNENSYLWRWTFFLKVKKSNIEDLISWGKNAIFPPACDLPRTL